MISKMLVVFALFYFIFTEVSVIEAKYLNQHIIKSRSSDYSRIIFPDDDITTHAPVNESNGLQDRFLIDVSKCASGLVRRGPVCVKKVSRRNGGVKKPKPWYW